MSERAPVEDTEQVAPEALPFGSSKKDLEHILRVNAESFRILYPRVKYFNMDREKTQALVHPLYKESKRKVFAGDVTSQKHPVEVPVLIVWQPEEKMLQRYGLEAHQGAMAVFCNRINEELGIDPVTGDLLEFLGKRFELMTVKIEDFFLNTQVALNKIATLKQLHPK